MTKMGIDVDQLNHGATYVPIDATMRYVKRQSATERGRQVEIPGDGENTNTISLIFTPIWPDFLYPCQRMDVYGATFPPIPPLTVKKIVDRQEIDTSVLMCLWDTMALLSRVQKLWDLVVKDADFCSTKWEGWVLNFVCRKCFHSLGSCMLSKNDPFKVSEIGSTKAFYEKFNASDENMQDIKVVFSKFNGRCLVFDLDEEGEDIDNINVMDCHSIIIFESYENLGNLYDGSDFKKIYNNFEFELRFISATWEIESRRGGRIVRDWDGFVYSRHGGSKHKKWWFFSRHNKLSVHVDGQFDFRSQGKVTLAYVRCDVLSFEKYKKDFLSYIGGRNNIFCQIHHSPLIASTTRDLLCSRCGNKKEFYKCCTFNCKICLCKDCLNSCDQRVPNYVSEDANVSTNDENGVRFHNNTRGDDDNVRTIEEDDESISSSTVDGDENSEISFDDLFNDNFEDFLISADDPDLAYGDDHDYIAVDDEQIPTTNAAEEAFHIRDEEGQRSINRVSGHVILNQCGSLLSRRDHEIKGSSKHQFFLQKIHSTTNGESIPLLYPESVLFPSIFSFEDPEGFPSVGCIPAPLLCRSMEQLGFESIPQHSRTRLSTPFCKLE